MEPRIKVDLLAINSELSLSSSGCVPKRGCAALRLCHLAGMMPLSLGTGNSEIEAGLPFDPIDRKRHERIVQRRVSNIYPASCTVTASGSIRRPAARRSSASASLPYGLRFPSTTDPP
jgi:hypothetical protein